MLSKMLNLFYIMDIFKTPLTLLFEKKRFISTNLGLLCSFGIFSIVLVMIINSDLFAKELPQIVSRNLPLIKRPSYTLNKKIIAIGVQNDKNFQGFIDDSCYTVKLQNFLTIANSLGGYEKKPIEKEFHACSEKDFDDSNIFSELGLLNNLCLNKEENSIEIEGFFDEPALNFVNIYLNLCDNSTSNNTCKSYDEMKKKLNGMTFNIYFQDTIIDAQDYENPIKHTIVNKYLYINLDSYKNMELYFQGVSLISDDGLVFSNINYYNDIGFTQQNLDYFSINEGDITTSRCCFLIFSAKNIQKFSRQYLKISDLLAKLGGIIQGLILICYVFVHIEQSLYIKNKILNSLFVFKTENKTNLQRKNKFNLPLSFIIPKNNGERQNNNEKFNMKFQTQNIVEGNNWRRKMGSFLQFFEERKKFLSFKI